MRLATTLLLAALAGAPLAATASEAVRLDRAPINENDLVSLQRGAQVFVNYCLNCHGAAYMRYNRLQEIGLSEPQIRDNLIFTGVKVGDVMQVAMDRKYGREWFGTAPPDLTVIARSRASASGSGADWLYTYLRSFYRDPSRPTGWNNLVFENVAMPHVLYELQGVQVLRLEEKAGARGKEEVRKLVREKPGTMTPVEYDRLVADLVNYLVFMGEPAKHDRVRLGIYVVLFLGVLFILAYALKKEYWKDVH
ncbi:MAG: cytochrome c1 [Betaproteobacteria bacterium]|nr:cytochrome c1 [Betaproteobacteria bacterium]